MASLHASHLTLHVFLSPSGSQRGLPLVYIFAKIKNKIHKYHVRIKKYAKKRKKHPIMVKKDKIFCSKKINK